MDDLHEDIVKAAKEDREAVDKRLNEIFAEQFKIGAEPADSIDVADGDPGSMIAALIGMNND